MNCKKIKKKKRILALIIPLLIGCIWGLMVHWIPLVHLRIWKKKWNFKKNQIFTCWLIMIRCTPWAHHLLWLWMWWLWCSRCAQVHWIHLIHKIIDRRMGMCYRCSGSAQWCRRSLKISVLWNKTTHCTYIAVLVHRWIRLVRWWRWCNTSFFLDQPLSFLNLHLRATAKWLI